MTQDLTKSSVHPMGGQAYLSLENSEDPFLHGIKFTAMPPSKRFREMEQLSGGEKVTKAHIKSHVWQCFPACPEGNACLKDRYVSWAQ